MAEETTGGYRIRDLEETQRPRERLESLGAGALSEAELIAILLRVGVKGENAVQMGHRLLKSFGGLIGLHRAGFEEVVNLHGMGRAKTAQLKAAIELGRRLRVEDHGDGPRTISSPRDAAEEVMYEMAGLNHEELWVLVVDTRNRLVSVEHLYKGSLNSSSVRVGELFRPAIQRSAASIIVAHNHPSGDPAPSTEDIVLTRAVVQAGKLLDIDVLDHIVIGKMKFVSMKERGLGFGSG